jgi:probable rRNA maturation factor
MQPDNTVNTIFKSRLKTSFKPGLTVLRILKEENKKGLEINLVFTDDKYIKTVNLEYRMKNTATDVISFEAATGGDMLISVEKASSQALEYGVTLHEELIRLLIHGTLHILGYDHIKSSDRVKMQAKERKYMKLLTENK